MTRMLYTGFVMNTKPNLPEEIGFGQMANWRLWRGSLNKGGAVWMFIVYLTDIPGALLIKHHQDWPLIRGDVFSALNLTRWHLAQMPFYNCTFTICLTYLFSGLGYGFFNRRYK